MASSGSTQDRPACSGTWCQELGCRPRRDKPSCRPALLRTISKTASSCCHGKLLAAVGPWRTMPRQGWKTRYEQESEMSLQPRHLPSSMIAALAALWLAAMPAWAESTFDQIKRTGELRYGAI